MAWKNIQVHWVGSSGKKYPYKVYALPQRFPRGRKGIFIYARITARHTWRPLYIGHGEVAMPFWGKPEVKRRVEESGATHIHVHYHTPLFQRRLEVQDLLERHYEVFTAGCNTYDSDFDPRARDVFSPDGDR